MTATSSRFFDEIAKLMSNASGAAQGVRKEIDTMVQNQVERVLNNLNVVKREEFDVVRDMAEKARTENVKLAERIAELEKAIAAGGGDGSEWHSGSGEDGRVDQHDVGHRQKGGDAGQNLGAPVGSQAREFKVAFESIEHRRVHLGEHTADTGDNSKP